MFLRPVLILLFFLSSFSLFSQPPCPTCPPGDPPSDPDADVPITGIEVIVGVGALFGAKKYFDLRKKQR